MWLRAETSTTSSTRRRSGTDQSGSLQKATTDETLALFNVTASARQATGGWHDADADAFVQFFVDKVKAVRVATNGRKPLATTSVTDASLPTLSPCSENEVWMRVKFHGRPDKRTDSVRLFTGF